jgi:DNA-binding transcriptional regulator YiaG
MFSNVENWADANRWRGAQRAFSIDRKRQSGLAPATCLAHWTFTQRTIHVDLPIKASVAQYKKPFPTGTVGDLIRARREEAGLTRRQLSAATGIPLYWLGRWERDRSFPNEMEWIKLGKVLKLPANLDSL